jgi:cold shock CspA family protein
MSERERGCIKWYAVDRGYGFIIHNGSDLFFHSRFVLSPTVPEFFQPGDEVSFVVGVDRDRKPCAHDVKLEE